MKLNKKLIISNTVLFIAILAFINVFNMFFGPANSVVGVTIITGALTLLQKDLTASPVENTINLIGINLFTGIMAYIASMNMWVGIPVNFIALFAIGYLFSSNLKVAVVIPFGLQYLFMLFTPVQGNDLMLRMCGLIFGGFFMMGLQFLANKNKLKKNFKNIIIEIMNDLIFSIENEKNKYDEINDKINKIKKIVYESRKKSFYICNTGKRVTNIIYLLERMNIIINENDINSDSDSKEYVLAMLKDLKDGITNENVELIKIEKFDGLSNPKNSELRRCIISLVKESKSLNGTKSNVDLQPFDIPEKFQIIKIMKDNFKLSSLRVSYGFRLAIVGAISILIVDMFNIPEGKWIVYSIFSLTQPYAETSKIRARQRIEGTLIGASIVVVSFILIKDSSMRGMIVLFAGYLNPYVKDYKKLIVLVTISAVASTVVSGGAMGLAISRVLFVIFGAMLSIAGSKLIIPFHIKDGNNEIKENYTKIIDTMNSDIEEGINENSIKSLYLLPAFFEEKFKATNICDVELSEVKGFADEKRKVLNEVYSKYYFTQNSSDEIDEADFALS